MRIGGRFGECRPKSLHARRRYLFIVRFGEDGVDQNGQLDDPWIIACLQVGGGLAAAVRSLPVIDQLTRGRSEPGMEGSNQRIDAPGCEGLVERHPGDIHVSPLGEVWAFRVGRRSIAANPSACPAALSG